MVKNGRHTATTADPQNRLWLKWQHEVVVTLRNEVEALEQICAHDIDWTILEQYFREELSAHAAIDRQRVAPPERGETAPRSLPELEG
jgi:hypothetical protein